MKKIIKILAVSMIMCCFCMTPAYAGNTEYDTLCMINEYGTKTFNALNHSDNTKTSKNVDGEYLKPGFQVLCAKNIFH